MPLMQNAPFEYGWSRLGVMSVARPSSTVTREPQQTEHSQHVLGWTAASVCVRPPDGRLAVWVTSVMAAAVSPWGRCVASDMTSIERRAARLDRRRPLGDLAAKERVEIGGRAPAFRHHSVPELRRALARLRVLKRGAERPGE